MMFSVVLPSLIKLVGVLFTVVILSLVMGDDTVWVTVVSPTMEDFMFSSVVVMNSKVVVEIRACNTWTAIGYITKTCRAF